MSTFEVGYPLMFIILYIYSFNSKEEEDRKKINSSKQNKDYEDDDVQDRARKNNISLLDQHTELKKIAEGKCCKVCKNCLSIKKIFGECIKYLIK